MERPSGVFVFYVRQFDFIASSTACCKATFIRKWVRCFLVATWLHWRRNPAEYAPLRSAILCVSLPPNVPTATPPTNLQAISVWSSWESGHLEALKQQSTPPDALSKLCRMVTWSRSSISATPSTACAEIRCFAQCFQQSRASTDSATYATATHLSSNSTTEQSCHRRVRIKAIHWLSLVLCLHPSGFAALAIWADGWLHEWSDAGRPIGCSGGGPWLH